MPTGEVVPGVLSRIQDAPVAGEGPAGTAACTPARTRRRGCHPASWRPSPPLRATRSLNGEVGSGIPIPRTAVPIYGVPTAKCLSVRQSLCGLLVLHDCSVENRVSGHLIYKPCARPPPLTDEICGRHRHRCVAFGKLSDFAGTLAKGAHVAIEGELRSHEYQRELAVGRRKPPSPRESGKFVPPPS